MKKHLLKFVSVGGHPPVILASWCARDTEMDDLVVEAFFCDCEDCLTNHSLAQNSRAVRVPTPSEGSTPGVEGEARPSTQHGKDGVPSAPGLSRGERALVLLKGLYRLGAGRSQTWAEHGETIKMWELVKELLAEEIPPTTTRVAE